MCLANFDRKEHLQHRAVSLRQHGFLVLIDTAAHSDYCSYAPVKYSYSLTHSLPGRQHEALVSTDECLMLRDLGIVNAVANLQMDAEVRI